MTRHTGSGDGPSQDDIYRCLAHHRRRRTLRILTDRASPVTATSLATQLATAESANAAGAPETESVLIDLHHTHLPMLERAGLLEWDRASRTVSNASASRSAVHDDPEFAIHLRRLDSEWDRVVSALAHRRRRSALALVTDRYDAGDDGRGRPIDVADLARAIVEREGREEGPAHERVLVSLHHEHLPTLANAGLLEYDRTEGTVTADGRVATELERVAGALEDEEASCAPLVSAPP